MASHDALPPRRVARLMLSVCTLLAIGSGSWLAAAPPAQPDVSTTAPDPPQVVRDVWEALFLGGSQVGHRHVTVRQLAEGSEADLVAVAEERLRFEREGQVVAPQVRYASRETSDGRLLSILCEEQLSGRPKLTTGRVAEGRLLLEVAGQPNPAPIDWPDDAGGYFALEQSLRNRPLAAGESRELAALMPAVHQLATVRLRAGDWEEVQLVDSSARLLRVDVETQLGADVVLSSVLWCDAQGEIFKSRQAPLDLVAIRTTRARALAEGDAPTVDLFAKVLVPIDPPIERPHQRQQIIYEVVHLGSKATPVFAQTARQRWQPLDGGRGRLTVDTSLGQWDDADGAKEADVPTAALKSSPLIDAADPAIRQLAHSVADGESDPWKTARRLERLVHATITEKNLASVFASASEVAQSREGDCTEHALLLAALCRARQIPARVAIGLVYVETAGGFLYHMWNEVWIAGDWRPLDATLGQAGIGPAHLKITHSLLETENAYTSLLPVVNVVGGLELRVVEVR